MSSASRAPDTPDLATVLRGIRDARGWTNAELADWLGEAPGVIAQWLARPPQGPTARVLARRLGRTVTLRP